MPTPGAITLSQDAFRPVQPSVAERSQVPTAPSADFAERSTGDVYAEFSDPNNLPADFFNLTSPRGLHQMPRTGLLVSANAGLATPELFGFPSDFQTFSSQRLFTAVGSNITDVLFYLPGTTTAATTSAFAAIFVDAGSGATKIEFFDQNNLMIFSQSGPQLPGTRA